MGLFDQIEAKRDHIGREVGLSADQVQAIANTLQANLSSSDGNPGSAIEAAAAQHGISITMVREIVTLGGGFESELGDFSGNLFIPGGNEQ